MSCAGSSRRWSAPAPWRACCRPRRARCSSRARPLAAWSRAARARRVALVVAEDEAPGRLAVEDRVALGRYPHRGPLAPFTTEDEAAVARALRLTEIEHLARRPLGTLSAGERQLALVARGLAQDPQVLLLDEPATHLDIRHQLHLFRVLDEVRQRGVAVLAVIHDLPRAAAWATRLVLLDEGRLTRAIVYRTRSPHDPSLPKPRSKTPTVAVSGEALCTPRFAVSSQRPRHPQKSCDR